MSTKVDRLIADLRRAQADFEDERATLFVLQKKWWKVSRYASSETNDYAAEIEREYKRQYEILDEIRSREQSINESLRRLVLAPR